MEYYYENEKAYYTQSLENFSEIDKTTIDENGNEQIESFESCVFFPTLVKISKEFNIKPELIAESLSHVLIVLNENEPTPYSYLDKTIYIQKDKYGMII